MFNSDIKTYIHMLIPKVTNDKVNDFYKDSVDKNVFQTKREFKDMMDNYYNYDYFMKPEEEQTLFITLRKILPEDYENIVIDLEKCRFSQFNKPESKTVVNISRSVITGPPNNYGISGMNLDFDGDEIRSYPQQRIITKNDIVDGSNYRDNRKMKRRMERQREKL